MRDGSESYGALEGGWRDEGEPEATFETAHQILTTRRAEVDDDGIPFTENGKPLTAVEHEALLVSAESAREHAILHALKAEMHLEKAEEAIRNEKSLDRWTEHHREVNRSEPHLRAARAWAMIASTF